MIEKVYKFHLMHQYAESFIMFSLGAIIGLVGSFAVNSHNNGVLIYRNLYLYGFIFILLLAFIYCKWLSKESNMIIGIKEKHEKLIKLVEQKVICRLEKDSTSPQQSMQLGREFKAFVDDMNK